MPTTDHADESHVGESDGAAGQALVDALAQTAFMVAALLSSIGAAQELSLTQVRLIGVLRDRRLRMAELADHLGLERSTMSGLIDRAERRGLLVRQRGRADGRVVEVTLTAAGRVLAERSYREVARALEPAVGRLEPGRQEQLAGLLREFLGPEPPTGHP